MASKTNDSAGEIDLTPYDFAGESCGSCHPGGGGLEYDRDGQRYDLRLRSNPGLKESLDGDYFRSGWDVSGVVEADCLICHLPGYNSAERSKQLEMRNYYWAATAGSGLGEVTGQVAKGEKPVVSYNKELFNRDGTVSLNIAPTPPGDNCLICHGPSDVKKRGFSWDDPANIDVHNRGGMTCTDCHGAVENEETGAMEHQLAKGNANLSTVRDDLDNTVTSCRECHEQGLGGAPRPEHKTVKPSHLEKISCQACHIPALNRTGISGFDVTGGKLVNFLNVLGAEKIGDPGKWYPSYVKKEDGKIYPGNYVVGTWWGNRDSDGVIYPLQLKEIKLAYEKYGSALTDDNGDGIPEANTGEEITAVLKVFREILRESQRFEQVHPVYIKGGLLYQLDDTGKLSIEKDPVAEAHSFSIDHNVAPADMALGANGCRDCHVGDAPFFHAGVTTDLFSGDGTPVTVPQATLLGIDSRALDIHLNYFQYRGGLLGLAFIGVFLLTLAHYKLRGPNGAGIKLVPASINRFSLAERVLHFLRMVSFIILGLTGLAFIYNNVFGLGFPLGSYGLALNVHWITGLVFTVTTLISVKMWFKDAIFQAYDKEWLRRMGGYLARDVHCPAGRFNAGQKLFFWLTSGLSILLIITGIVLMQSNLSVSLKLVAVTVHGISAIVIILGVLVHAYLGTAANPGTWQVLWHGKVSADWARTHHPNWYQDIKDQDKS